MCGSASLLYPHRERKVSVKLIRRMTRAILYRGPANGTSFVEGPVRLAHRRLKIIDLEGGKQPIFNETCSMAIVFNGEIYNYLSLRED